MCRQLLARPTQLALVKGEGYESCTRKVTDKPKYDLVKGEIVWYLLWSFGEWLQYAQCTSYSKVCGAGHRLLCLGLELVQMLGCVLPTHVSAAHAVLTKQVIMCMGIRNPWMLAYLMLSFTGVEEMGELVKRIEAETVATQQAAAAAAIPPPRPPPGEPPAKPAAVPPPRPPPGEPPAAAVAPKAVAPETVAPATEGGAEAMAVDEGAGPEAQ